MQAGRGTSEEEERMNAEDELAAIRVICERTLTANPDDSTRDLVHRLAYLTWPETAARHWFERWQRISRDLRDHLDADTDPCADRGEGWPCHVARALALGEQARA